MPVASRTALVRIALIDREIRKGDYPNATTLSRQLEVNPRTIHRDLDCLRDRLGAPLAFDRPRNGFHYTDATFRLPLPQITEGEYVALFLAGRLLREYRAAPFFKDIVHFFQKIKALLPDKVSLNLEHLAQGISVRPPPASPDDAERFRLLCKAVNEGRRLEIVYWTASRDAVARRVVDPYGLTLADDWYLAAHCHLREDVLLFATSRIREVKELDAFFERPADFSLNHYLDDALRLMRGGRRQTYRLRFSPVAARYVRDKSFHRTQKVEELEGGAIILSVEVNHPLEIKHLALSFGADCEVLAPEDLRQEVEQELKETLSMYHPAEEAANHVLS